VRALAARLAEPGHGAHPTREMIEIGELLLVLEESQLPEALALLEGFRASPSVKPMLLSTLFLRWTEFDPAAALERTRSIADPHLRSTASQAVLSAWAEADSRAAWNHVIDRGGAAEQLQLFVAMATRDPLGAATLVQQIEDSATRNRAYVSLAAHWSDGDPRAALRWSNSVEDETVRRQILPIVLGALAQEDPSAALELALAEADASVRQPAVYGILARVVRGDPDVGLALLDQLTDEFPLESMAMILGGSLVAADAGKIRSYMEKLPEGPARVNLLNTIVQLKVNRGVAEEVPPLLDLLPEGSDREGLYQTFGGSWGRDEPQRTSRWIEQLPSGSERDRALQGLSWARVGSDPQAALRWAASIDEPQQRDRQLRDLVRQWLRREPEAAVAWLESSDFVSPDVREELLQRAAR